MDTGISLLALNLTRVSALNTVNSITRVNLSVTGLLHKHPSSTVWLKMSKHLICDFTAMAIFSQIEIIK